MEGTDFLRADATSGKLKVILLGGRDYLVHVTLKSTVS